MVYFIFVIHLFTFQQYCNIMDTVYKISPHEKFVNFNSSLLYLADLPICIVSNNIGVQSTDTYLKLHSTQISNSHSETTLQFVLCHIT
jgi:hypothetical protein